MKIYRLLLLLLLMMMLPHAQAEVLWASKVISYSSEYTDSDKSPQFRAIQVLGKPNILPAHGSSPVAWSPSQPESMEEEWIHVGFERAMFIQQVAIGESHNPGAVKMVYLYDEQGKEYLVYTNFEGEIPNEKSRVLNVMFAPTRFQVASVKVVLDTRRVEGWNHIDAIGISDEREPVKATINVAKNAEITRIEPLGPNVNTPYEEVFPVISPDGKTLYFDRKNHPENTQSSTPNDDIWFATKIGDAGNNWSKAKKMGTPLNNRYHNYVCSVTPDGNTLLLGNEYYPDGRVGGGISMTNRTENGWSFPQPLDIEGYVNNSDNSEFCLSNNRKVLVLAIQTSESLGDRDLYVSFLKSDGSWSKPKHMGKQINSADTELTPFLASDNYTLYFSSRGFSGYGITDMFMARRLDDTWTNWTEPINLGPTLNSSDWDASYSIDASGEYAYFVSYKNSTNRSADIYRAKLPPEAQPAPVTLVTGTVYNSKTKKPISAEIIYEILPKGEEVGTALSTPSDGQYTIALPSGQKYGFWARAAGFIPVNENLDLIESDAYGEIRRDLYLTPLEVGQSVRLNNVEFILGRDILMEESYPELNRVARIMIDNPKMQVLLEGHTDYIGNPIENMNLSKARVIAVKKYLMQRGIEGDRISVEAYGGNQPLVRDPEQEKRKINRRVEFKIVTM